MKIDHNWVCTTMMYIRVDAYVFSNDCVENHAEMFEWWFVHAVSVQHFQ